MRKYYVIGEEKVLNINFYSQSKMVYVILCVFQMRFCSFIGNQRRNKFGCQAR